MKLLIYMILLLGVALLPTEATDVGKLIPVEVIAVSENRGIVTVETDTGDAGQGRTLEEAFEDMEKTAPGVIYLDTAAYLILEPGMEGQAATLGAYLKDSVRVCRGREGIPLEGIAAYLAVHKPDVKLKAVPGKAELLVIREENGRYELSEK